MRESGVLYGLSSQRIGMHVKHTYTTEKSPMVEIIERYTLWLMFCIKMMRPEKKRKSERCIKERQCFDNPGKVHLVHTTVK